MFEHLAQFNIILVGGPQRAGTKIGARMIAHDTGHEYVDELDIGFAPFRNPHVLPNFMGECRKIGRKVVVQCPGWTERLYELSADDVLIAIMHRNINDIVASRERIGWKADNLGQREQLQAVYNKWNATWRPRCRHSINLEYGDLAKHPLWIPPSKRGHWRRNDEWQSREPCLMLVKIANKTSPHTERICQKLGEDGIDALFLDVGVHGIKEFALRHRPHYAVFVVDNPDSIITDIEKARVWGCKTVLASTKEALWADEPESVVANPRIDMAIPDFRDVHSALLKLGHGEHPRDMPQILWKDPQTKRLQWTG